MEEKVFDLSIATGTESSPQYLLCLLTNPNRATIALFRVLSRAFSRETALFFHN